VQLQRSTMQVLMEFEETDDVKNGRRVFYLNKKDPAQRSLSHFRFSSLVKPIVESTESKVVSGALAAKY